MLIDMNGVIYALSYALDCIEREIVGVERNHSKWVAYLSALMGKACGLTQQECSDLASCAALHDNALTQYLADERSSHSDVEALGIHCTMGSENVLCFPFKTDTTGFILYHHENADGSGPFKKTAKDTPLQAQIIHLGDMLDAVCRFHEAASETYERIQAYLKEERDRQYDGRLIDVFYKVMPKERYLALCGVSVDELLDEELYHRAQEYSFEQVKAVMDVFGKIVDYKSPFTRRHSEGIAERVLSMAEYYGYDTATAQRLYVAGALHDIGKMTVANDILEKPDKLTDREFGRMQNHAWHTYKLLSRINGFEDITQWASLHHEKLNGSGYPFGKKAEELSEKDRLMACVDIYQALSEDRPYKSGMPHEKCMEIMYNMVDRGLIDGRITADMDSALRTKEA